MSSFLRRISLVDHFIDKYFQCTFSLCCKNNVALSAFVQLRSRLAAYRKLAEHITMKFDFFSRKKFKCDICNEKFKTEADLRQHNKMEHGSKS
jgi:Zinc-finger of C2H2 type